MYKNCLKQFIFSLIYMEEKQIQEVVVSESIQASKEVYAPSSTEKKRAVMMYLLIWIIVVALNNQKKKDFELFHLQQALWWWAIFLLLIVATSIFILLPIIRYIPTFIIIIMIIFIIIFIKRAWDGKYSIQEDNKLAIFYALWGWIMTLFETQPEEKIPEIEH